MPLNFEQMFIASNIFDNQSAWTPESCDSGFFVLARKIDNQGRGL